MRLLGLDPGLRLTGWGIIEAAGSRLVHVADGVVAADPKAPLALRLVQLHDGLVSVIRRYNPEGAAVEESFVSLNASSTLKLGLARAIALLVPAQAGLPVAEYSAKLVKKSVVGVGAAGKDQVEAMVRRLLPGCLPAGADAADALAVAICHAHHAQTARAWRVRESPA
jgi:crossover junction endodeoxyribonuclease RuvC